MSKKKSIDSGNCIFYIVIACGFVMLLLGAGLQINHNNIEKLETKFEGYQEECLEYETVEKHKVINDVESYCRRDNACYFEPVYDGDDIVAHLNYCWDEGNYSEFEKCLEQHPKPFLEFYNETVCVKQGLVRGVNHE